MENSKTYVPFVTYENGKYLDLAALLVPVSLHKYILSQSRLSFAFLSLKLSRSFSHRAHLSPLAINSMLQRCRGSSYVSNYRDTPSTNAFLPARDTSFSYLRSSLSFACPCHYLKEAIDQNVRVAHADREWHVYSVRAETGRLVGGGEGREKE